ncbi:MAG: type IV toxin-antitoxin system AbiEi family antitoxin domain-containing protein [Clostridiales Family XIII bacterium]|jgi:predicted transcriptional regulator of viral defense system|nr:type IV toxin-antitoxin system AbiEi family antitoxin domain-containing protein [Clostridiales Family XIII bacterium]
MVLDLSEKIRSIIVNAGGVARTSDFNAAGFANYSVSELCRRGLIARVRSGYYALPEQEQREEETLAQLFGDGIVCYDSALFHYGYSDKAPLEWHMAFPRSVTRSRFDTGYPPVHCYMVQKNILDLGVTTGDWEGVSLKVYDRERIICDSFKRRAQMDSETFIKAVNAYAADDKKNLMNLSDYARKLRVYTKVTELMEVLLNG